MTSKGSPAKKIAAPIFHNKILGAADRMGIFAFEEISHDLQIFTTKVLF